MSAAAEAQVVHHFAAPKIVPRDIGCCGKMSSACLGRFLMFENVYDLQLWADELNAVQKNYEDVQLDDRRIATRYLCWRRSVLGCALLPYALSLALRLKTLAGSLDKADFLSSISPETDLVNVEEYYPFFEPYFYVHVGVQALYATSLVLSLVMMAVAFRTWADFQSSRRWLRASYLLSFAVPYLVLLIAPYKQAIDGDGAELKLCEDMLQRANESLSSARFECSMPDATMCKKPADQWTPVVMRTLNDCGVLRDPTTGTCPFAAQYADRALAQSSLAASELDPTVRLLCEQDAGCFPCIEPADATNGGATCSNLGLAVAGPRSVRERCARCFQPVADWRAPSPPTVSLTAQEWTALEAAGVGRAGDDRLCAQICAPLLVPGLSADYASQLSGGKSFCVGDGTVEVINAVTALALHFDKVEHAVGVFQALVTLATLFPASFSLMFGSIKGSTLCKTLLPWSRLPVRLHTFELMSVLLTVTDACNPEKSVSILQGYMIGAAIVFCLPMFMALLAVIYQLVGDWYCMLAFFSLLLSLLIWLPMGDLSHSDESAPNGATVIVNSGVLAPQSHTAASAEFTCRGRISNVFKVLTVMFIVLFALGVSDELDKDERQVTINHQYMHLLINATTLQTRHC